MLSTATEFSMEHIQDPLIYIALSKIPKQVTLLEYHEATGVQACWCEAVRCQDDMAGAIAALNVPPWASLELIDEPYKPVIAALT